VYLGEEVSCEARVRAAVFRLLGPHLRDAGLSERALDESRSLIELGVIDSFTFVDVLTALQEELGVEIDFMELDPDDFDSVKGLVRVAVAAVEHS
jgi:acyl carrier protein